MFYKNWYERGIRFVNDLFDENGSLLSYESFSDVWSQNQFFRF